MKHIHDCISLEVKLLAVPAAGCELKRARVGAGSHGAETKTTCQCYASYSQTNIKIKKSASTIYLKTIIK